MAMIQALGGTPSAPGGYAMDPAASGAAPSGQMAGGPLQQQDMSQMYNQMAAAGQNSAMGDGTGTALGAAAMPPSMYSAMMTPPPAPNYWG